MLLALAAPAIDMRFGMPDAGNGPEELTSRQAYDLMSEGFGPGANGPFLVAVDLAGAADEGAATEAVDRLAADLARHRRRGHGRCRRWSTRLATPP